MKVFLTSYATEEGFLLEKKDVTLKKIIRTIKKIYFMNSKLTDRRIIGSYYLCNILVEKFDFSSNLKVIKVEDLGENVVKTNLYKIEESLDKETIHIIDLDEQCFNKFYFKTYNFMDSLKDKYYYSFEKEVSKDKNSNEIYTILYKIIKEFFEENLEMDIKELNEVIHSEKLKKWFI
ncbi:hypothetical protein [Cetobacterium somerae]